MREELKARAPEGSAFEPPWSSLNVGSFNGGSAANVIAGTAEVEWDFRAVQDSDTAFIEAREAAYINDVLLPAMRSVYPEASVESVIKGDVAGLMPVEESEAVRILSELAGTNAAGVVAFGTEARSCENCAAALRPHWTCVMPRCCSGDAVAKCSVPRRQDF